MRNKLVAIPSKPQRKCLRSPERGVIPMRMTRRGLTAAAIAPLLAVLVLETLPFGAAMVFAAGELVDELAEVASASLN